MAHNWLNGLDGRALAKQVVTASIPGVPHIFGIVWILIPACLIKQPNGSLSRMCV